MRTIVCRFEYFFIIIAVMFMAVSCNHGRSSSMLKVADSLSDVNPDSAYNILYSMTSYDVSSEDNVAYYGMLMSYVLNKQTMKTDTVPLSYSIAYYGKVGNKPMLQRCWLYMGTIRLRSGAPLVSVENDFVKAERLIKDVGDTLVAMRIYERLAVLNIKQNDTINALRYARLLNSLSACTTDGEWRMRGYNAMALAMGLAGQRDSMMLYVGMAVMCIPDSVVPGMNRVYNKVAFMQMHVRYGDVSLAEHLLKKSIAGGTDWRTLNLLADLYLKTGRDDEAFSIIGALMSSDNARSNIWLYNSLSEYYAEKGRFKDAYAMRLKRDSIMTVVDKQLDVEFATNMWRKYDSEVVRRFARRKIALIVFIGFVVITLVLSSFVISGRRLRKRAAQISALKNDLLQMQIRINKIKDDSEKSVMDKTEELKDIISEKQMAINKLNSRLSVSKEELNGYSTRLDEIEQGLHYFYSVMCDQNISQLNKIERESLIECYRIIDVAFVHRIEGLEGCKLTIQEKLYCVLRNMGKDENAIKYMLGLSDEAYRKTRSRALNKLRCDVNTIDIADKIK